MGGRNSSKRSARQTEDGRFWLALDGRVFYPLVRQVAGAKELNVVDCARLFALVAMARADSLIAVFDAKYHYEFWRPVTAIRNGDIDDNPATERDAAWQPLDATPMHPEYPCAHCIESASMAAVVETVLGTADIPEVSMTSPTAPGVVHHWTNVRDFVNEVSEARIWSGFHWRLGTGSHARWALRSAHMSRTISCSPSQRRSDEQALLARLGGRSRRSGTTGARSRPFQMNYFPRSSRSL